MGERLVCNQEVEGSSPFGSIRKLLCDKHLRTIAVSGWFVNCAHFPDLRPLPQ